MDEDKQKDMIVALYNQAMEDLRHRARVEWQTFIVVNIIYGAGIKKLLDSPKECFTPFGALILTTATGLFTFIWLVRFYGTAQRSEFPRRVRNRIQKYAKTELGPCTGGISIPGLIPSPDITGGYPRWRKRELFERKLFETRWWRRGKKRKRASSVTGSGGSWPLWTYRGICIAIGLYWITFEVILWGYKTEGVFKKMPEWVDDYWFIVGPIVSLLGVFLALYIDKKLVNGTGENASGSEE